MSVDETKWFFEAYCRCPVAFHAIHYSVANHRDRIVGRLRETGSAKTIRHKVDALHLLNLAISAFQTDSTDIGWLLLALTALMRNEPTMDDLQPDKQLAFRPWSRDINNAAIFGRGKSSQTLPLHTKAFEQVLPASSDILSKLPRGLAKSIAGRLVEPRYPNIWSSKDLRSCVLLIHGAHTGQGFHNHVPGGLPLEATATLSYLCAVNRAVGGGSPSIADHSWLHDAVRDAQHRIMSLSPWEDLSKTARADRQGTYYEICRLTTMLYANAVLYALPFGNGWHLELLARLRAILDRDSIDFAHPDAGRLMVWCLCVASIAALDTDQWLGFAKFLRRVILAQQMSSWEAVENIVKQFLWSERACGPGASAVWQLLQIDDLDT
ncbi:hypothetical protein LTR86_001278 [Recurvomyces mirabilis]|nr:hypothetical protein LTR86_001278 [Recurvomyces mirabilis]